MERREALEAKQQGRRPRRLTEWDFLIGVSDSTRLGALRLRQSDQFIDDRDRTIPPFARLRELERIALELDRDDNVEDRPEYAQWLAQLIAPGTSLGGARPKACVSDESGQLWLAKFPAHDDRHDVGAWEGLAAALARTAGIDVSEHRLLKLTSRYHTYAVKRFDRDSDTRRLYASAMTLLRESDGATRSYVDIAEAISTYGDPDFIEIDLAQLYRRIMFSILLANRDDHLRNHGFLRSNKGWRLSPVFDVNPNPYKAEHALAIDEVDPSPSVEHLHATCGYYRLTSTAAAQIEAEVRDAVRSWPQRAAGIGISASERRQLEGVIDPDAA
jgi:serine/threonine-protein kinase HipA